MGKGIDLARLNAPEHANLIDELRDQLLIAFLRRLGGSVEMPVSEVDETGEFCLAFSLDIERKVFAFSLTEKNARLGGGED